MRQNLVDNLDNHLGKVLTVQNVGYQKSKVLLFDFKCLVFQSLLDIHMTELLLVVRDADESSRSISMTHC